MPSGKNKECMIKKKLQSKEIKIQPMNHIMLWKAFLACILFFLCSFIARSQYILNEDFQQGIPGTWTLINNDSRTPDSLTAFVTSAWVAVADSSDTTDIIAVSTSKYSPPGAADDWLVTSILSLGGSSIVTWHARAFSATAADGYEVRVSTSTPTIAGFSAHAPLFSVSAENTAWTKHSIDLAALGYSNQPVYLAFRNNSSNKFLLAIDDITLFDCNTLHADAGVIDTSTTISCAGNPDLNLGLLPSYLSSAPGNIISGNTNDVPNWNPLPGRPYEDWGCCETNSSPPYQVVPFQVTATGNYDIVQTQAGYDGMMFIYTDPFDLTVQVFLNPGFGAGITFVAGNDDSASVVGPPFKSAILDLPLTQGTTYYLVSTGFYTNSFGDYTTIFTGPGNILLEQQAELPFDYGYVVTNSGGMIVSIGDDLTDKTTFPGSLNGDTFSVCGVSYVEANLDLTSYVGQALSSFTNDISTSNCADITSACHRVVILSEGTADAGRGDTVCAGTSVILNASGGISYSWSTGASTASVTVTPIFTTTYTVTVTNTTGCTATDDVTVSVFSPDAGTFNTSALHRCQGDGALNLSLSPEFSKNFISHESNIISGNSGRYFSWLPLDGRPHEDGTCCTQNHSAYNVNLFQVDKTGIYEFIQHQQGYDGLMLLYTDPFDLTVNPPVTFIAGDDDSAGIIGISYFRDTLFASQTYYLVSTGLDAGNYGNYVTTIRGPGNVLVPVPPDTALFGYNYVIVNNTGVITAIGSDLSDPVAYPGSPSGNHWQVCAVSYLEDSYDLSAYIGGALADLYGLSCLDVSDNCKPVAIFTEPVSVIATPSQTVCFNDTVPVSGNTPAFGSGQWTFFRGGGIIENIFLPDTRVYGLAPGLNTLAWTVSNPGCSVYDTVDIFVIKPPADAGADIAVCRGDTVTLSATGGLTYLWNTGQTTASITFAAFITKSYIVTVTDSSGCSASDSVTVRVNLPPVVNIPDLTICPGSTAILNAGNPGSSYLWSTGATTQSIAVTSEGTYSVTVTDANGCVKSDAGTITFGAGLSVMLNDVSICEGDSAVLSAGNFAGTFSWSTGAATPTITVTDAGVYSVTVVDTNNCAGADTATVVLLPLPPVSAGNDQEICKGESVMLTASGNGTGLRWSTGDTTASIMVSPVSSSSFAVTMTAANGCTVSDVVTVTVHPLPSVNLGADTSICYGETKVLAASGGVIYTWNTGESTASIEPVIIATSMYSVTATTAFGCMASDNIVITVKALPSADAGRGDTVCAGEPVTLIASGGGTYSWSNGSGSNFIIVFPAVSGYYYVTVTSAFNGCSASDSVHVKVNPVPSFDFSSTEDICNGSTLTLSASGGDSYSWSTGETSSSIDVSPSSDRTYSVTASTNMGCIASDTVRVVVRPIPVAYAGQDVTICDGEQISLTATGGTDYHWSTGSNQNPLPVRPSDTTTYSVTVSNVYGCEDTDEVTVNVKPTPAVILFGFDTLAYCLGHQPIIIGGTPVGGTLSGPGVSNGRFVPAEAGVGIHTITYSFTDINGCTGVDSKEVTVDPCIGIAHVADADIKIYPNPAEQYLFVEATGMQNEKTTLKIFDAAGRTVYASRLYAEKQKIDLTAFAPGLYLLKVVMHNRSVMRQFAKN